MPSPLSHTPLIALPVVVLDLETTGLDVKNDRVVQIAAITMHGVISPDKPKIESLVNPDMRIPQSSTKIHGIIDADVSDAPPLLDFSGDLKELLQECVVVGHNIGFDMAILRHEFSRLKLVWHEPATIDIRQVVGALQPTLPDLGLETVASHLGVVIENRHTATGDCTAAAQAWARLIPILRENEINTLGEVLALAKQRQDLILRQHDSGWFDQPGSLVTSSPIIATRIDSYMYEHRVKDLMTSPPEMINTDASLREAALCMEEHQVGCLLIGELDDGIVKGIITERDLIRYTANEELKFSVTKVSQVMSSPVESIASNEMLYRALARMDRLRISHLCVIDKAGVPIGVVSQRDLLQYRARGALTLSDALDVAIDAVSLAAAYSQVNAVASGLVNEGLGGSEIAHVISTELRALTARAAQLCIEKMAADGKGAPPADWCVLVLGSGGRGESLLIADQDNALIHSGTESDDPWFAEFGGKLADMLNEAGVPYCQGDVMVSTDLWRGTVEQWHKRLDDWLRRAHPGDLLNVDIFFDLAPVAGNLELARQLHLDATRVASSSRTFLGLMAQSVKTFAPRFSMLGRLPLQDGRINLKRDGLLSLVSLARTLALRVGSTSRATPSRLRDAVIANRIAEGDAERLIQLHNYLLTYILNQQLQDKEAGIQASSNVVVKNIPRKQYTELIRGLKHLDTMVREAQSLVAS